MRIGDFDVYPLLDGYFRLDGGAMFGVVPRVLWEKTNPPDDRNRILLALGTLLVKAHGKHVLIDTGLGNKGEEKFCDIYAVDRRPSIEESLAKVGLTPRDIQIVVNTHFHFDHAGGDTTRMSNGRVVPTFPNAEYYVQRGEWQVAMTPNEPLGRQRGDPPRNPGPQDPGTHSASPVGYYQVRRSDPLFSRRFDSYWFPSPSSLHYGI